MTRVILFLALLLPSLGASASNFPQPAALQPAVDFWVKVYARISTSQGYIHDDTNLSVIYQTLDLPLDTGERERRIADAQKEVVAALRSLGAGKRTDLSPIEAQVLAAWPAETTSGTFTQAAQRVRFQRGQSDRFREGLVRSGQWRSHIREVLARHDLPPELEVLPHVESSFNPSAWSKAAAAGMWQFMPATARQYMRVDHIIDERMDPFIATEGAARLLKANYALTGTWPLALTGYNHGAAGMKRAAKTVGSTDIDVIVQRYQGPAFGFASRNFYASFLAALQIDRDPERYFPQATLDSPIQYDEVIPQDYISASGFAQEIGISLEELKQHNPALRDPIWTGEKHIPRGFPVRVPEDRLSRPLDDALASLSIVARFNQQKPDRVHRIAQGDSLSTIASRYRTTVSRLMALNGLRNHSIRAGKTLLLPGGAATGSLTAEQVAATRARLANQSRDIEYVIRSGDSLWSIARRFNVSTRELLAWNAIPANAYLQPGQKLKIARAG